MLKKVLIGVLALTVIGSGAAIALYQSSTNEPAPQPAVADTTGQEMVYAGQQGFGDGAAGGGAPNAAQNAEPAADVGEPWTGVGTISAVDDFGLTLALTDGSAVYVELGPPDFWQAQGVELLPGDLALVEGFASDGQYHAGTLTLADGRQIQVRNETGQPLWSGGATNGQGQANGLQDGEHVPQPQVAVDEWLTFEGVIVNVAQNSLTIETTSGETLTFQLGRPQFAAEQGITFSVGQNVVVVGFTQNNQFSAADITIVETGERLMLRDPNGRPLWAGPGNGNGNGGQ